MISTNDETTSDSASIVIAKASAASMSCIDSPSGFPGDIQSQAVFCGQRRSRASAPRLSVVGSSSGVAAFVAGSTRWVDDFGLFSGLPQSHIAVMAKTPEVPKKSRTPKSKAPKSKAPSSKASRPDVQPIAPALAELLNPAINRGDAGMGSGTGLQPPPDNSWDRRAGGEAAAHRARASTKGTSDDVAKRDVGQGLEEAPQANYGTAATIPTLDPELARQLGLPTAEDDDEALARPPRNKMEALGVKATAEALENLIRDGRPEFKGDDGQLRVWAPHRPPRPEKSEGGVRFEIKSEYEPKGDQPTAIKDLVEGIARNDRTQVLLGVTGSGKTYTIAKAIEPTPRPAIIPAQTKTLAAHLSGPDK